MTEQKKALQAKAAEVYGQYGFSKESVNLLKQEILNSPDVLDEALNIAAYDLMTGVQHTVRSTISGGNGGMNKPRIIPKAMQMAVEEACGKYYNWPLMNGAKLADANRDHILKDAERYQANADGNAKNARFLRLVASQLQGTQTVKEVLSESQLALFMNRARNQLTAEGGAA
jgi:hypothetical protein